MTDSIFFSPRYLPLANIPQSRQQAEAWPEHRSPRPVSPSPRRHRMLMPAEDRVSQGIMLGLFAVTLPAVVYSLLQAWGLVGGDTLNHAVRAFIP